jgi:Ca2+-binding RTX toxin-like protein
MAFVYGTDFAEDIFGFDEDDNIYGYGGDDDAFGYAGADDIYTGAGDDWVAAGLGDDLVYGQSGDDILYGQTHDDDLYGGSGADDLFGGSGNDFLIGGTGSDYLAGGSGADRYVVTRGTSGISSKTADVIADWNPAFDFVDMPIRGTFDNYAEGATTASTIAAAADDAEYWYSDLGVNHVFLYNSVIDRGFLLSDLNNDTVFETGMVLNKRGYASDFSYLDII